MSAAHGVGSKIGWIGAGRMGQAMIRRLLAAGYDVAVWNRTRAKAEGLLPAGASIVDRAADLAERPIVFTTVAADADLLAVTVGDGGLLTTGHGPTYLVDSSTVSAEVSDQVRLAAARVGTTLLAAPVSGNAKVVRAGKLSIAVSGPADAYEAVRPVLAALGRSVTHVGDGDVARLVKLAHNIFLGVVAQSLAEITVLAERGGVPRATFLEFVNGSVLGSVFSRYKTPAMVNLDFAPTFTTELLRKDFDLGLAAARALEAPMPVAAAAYQRVQAAVGAGHRDEDFASLLVEQARDAGLTLRPEGVEVDDGLPPDR